MKKSNIKPSGLINMIRKISFIWIFLFVAFNVNAQQYNIAGTATPISPSGCYSLTNALSQGGAVWNIYTIDLTHPFDITLTLNFGNRPDIYWDNGLTCGGDGMSFVLQPLSSSTVSLGSGVGFHGITPSLGVIMDTYHYNPTDPPMEHISISKNGDELHATTNELVSYTAAVGFPANITDGMDHLFHFTWTPTPSGVGTINVYFGTSTTLPPTPTISYTGNIVANIFSGNPNVYWGVSASTGGCWNTQTVCMTTIANFNANAVTCPGIPHDFTSNSVSGLPITSYLWHFGDGDSSTIQNPTHTYVNPGVYNVDLTIANSGGFTSTMTHTVTVNPNPVMTITASANPICVGDSTLLTASGATSYSWSGGFGTINPIKVAPIVTTTYTVTGTLANCTGTGNITITVNPHPTVSIAATANPVCAGIPTTLTASGATSYTWSGGLGITNPLTVTPLTTTTYTVTGTTLGCTGTSNLTVTVNPYPIVSVTASADTLCAGDSTTLTASGATTYTWNNSLGTTNPIKIAPASTTNYIVIGSTLGCADTANVNIIVNPVPIVSISASLNPICAGDSTILTASGALNYSWSGGLGTTNPITLFPPAPTTYTVIGNSLG
ncbi:MAG: PKD domain-containing protein, partial [Bacteroidota bacterium]